MEKSLIPFAFGENMVRAHLDENGDPWFVAKDVCRVLGLENNRDAVSNLDEDEKITVANPDGNPREGIPHQFTLVSESGLYTLAFRSRKPEAKHFRKWVTSEVLPALRKTGGYALPGHGLPLADMPETALRLRPALREKVLDSAMQAARIIGVSSPEEIDALYLHYCALVGGAEPGLADEVRDFFYERCVIAQGKREWAASLYEAFRAWRGRSKGSMPSMKSFSQNLARFARRSKSNYSVFHDIALRGV